MATATMPVSDTLDEPIRREKGERWELIDGQLVQRPHMGAQTNLVLAELFGLLIAHARAGKLGLCFTHDCGFQIFADDPKRYRYPDVAFVKTGRLTGDKPPTGHMRIPPDLVVEVVSPNDLAVDLDARITDYLGAGVPLMWVVYSSTRHIQVYRQDGIGNRLGVADTLDGEDVLPGFTCQLGELFAVI